MDDDITNTELLADAAVERVGKMAGGQRRVGFEAGPLHR